MFGHECPYGDYRCGLRGYSSLCEFCKKKAEIELKKADLEVESRINEARGMDRIREQLARDEAGRLLVKTVVENPVESLLVTLLLGGTGMAVSAAIDSREDRLERERKSKKGGRR